MGAPGVGLDRTVGLPHNLELPIRLDLADHHRFRKVVVSIHHDFKSARRLDLLAVHCLTYRVDICGACLTDRLNPHLEADEGRFHRVVGYPLRVLDKGMPFLDKRLILRRFHGLEIVPCSQMTDQIFRVDSSQLPSPTEKATTGMSSALIP